MDTLVSREAVAPSMASMAEWVAGVWAVERAASDLRLGRRAANPASWSEPGRAGAAGAVATGALRTNTSWNNFSKKNSIFLFEFENFLSVNLGIIGP